MAWRLVSLIRGRLVLLCVFKPSSHASPRGSISKLIVSIDTLAYSQSVYLISLPFERISRTLQYYKQNSVNNTGQTSCYILEEHSNSDMKREARMRKGEAKDAVVIPPPDAIPPRRRKRRLGYGR
ncbi:hypothetical protein PUN28_003120 [Cardiocondyla obscurior]|uniref:Secreted protein n=1 Tax=Cardiocondyla obscurior TaxID=286306 RepID=A0AAW2GHX1_9HYME